jgi:hypothetical protein
MTEPLYSQEGFRFRSDEAGVVWLETELTNHSHSIEDNLRIRFEIENTNNKAANNKDFDLYAQRNGAGGYVPITLTSTYIQISPSAEFADGAADSVNRLTTSTATFTAGELDEDGLCGDGGWLDFAGNDQVEFCIKITSASSASDYFDIRVYETGVALNNYAYTPRLTATAPANKTINMGYATLVASGQALNDVLSPGIAGTAMMSHYAEIM